MDGGGLVGTLFVALLLGLRHATDPDHLTAVSTLVLREERHGARRACGLALAWGLGHAATLLAFGLPVVLLDAWLPDVVGRTAEFAIGLLIVALGARLLVRWRRAAFHSHPHSHGGIRHAHPHGHERAHDAARTASADHAHEHRHADSLGRSPLASFGIGTVHGVGGSAGASILLVAALPGPAAVAGLAIFALGTAVSMALVSAAFGAALERRTIAGRIESFAPAAGLASLLFGIYYAAGSLPFGCTLP